MKRLSRCMPAAPAGVTACGALAVCALAGAAAAERTSSGRCDALRRVRSGKSNSPTNLRSRKTGATSCSTDPSRGSRVSGGGKQAGREFRTGRRGDATLPSISADGRYVSFTTSEGASLPTTTDGKVHQGVREAPGVYVRDMVKKGSANPESGEAEFEPGAFTSGVG